MPVVSVIVPIYNVDKYLSRCLDSVLAQTFKDIEVICINDGSTDKCAEILEDYAAQNKCIKIITQENKGLSEARNIGVRQAFGEYIYFLDSDDAIEPQTIEFCYQTAVKFQADLVCFKHKKSNGEVFPSAYFDIKKVKIVSNPLFCGCFGKNRVPFSVCTKFYKKDLLSGINFISGIQFEDFSYTYSVLLKHPKTVFIPLQLYLYTKNINSISHQTSHPKQILDYHTGINFVLEKYSQKGYEKELKFFLKNGLPRLLKHQYKKCSHASIKNASEMWKIFGEELADLQKKGFLSPKGHNLWRYFQYKKLLKNRPKSNIKIAVQIFGHLRTFEKCAASLKQNLLNLYDCDVFMHTWDETEHSTQTHHKNKSKVKKVDAELVKKLESFYSLKSIKVEHQNVQDLGNISCQCKQNSEISVFGLSCMYHSQNEVNNLRRQYQKEQGTQYDYVIFVRPDVFLNKPFILEKLDNELMLMQKSKECIKFAAHGRYLKDFALVSDRATDILFVTSQNTADKICEILQHIDFSKYKVSLWNPENMVTQELEENRILTYLLMYQANDDWQIMREKKILKNLVKLKIAKCSYLKLFTFLPRFFSIKINVFKFRLLFSIGCLDD